MQQTVNQALNVKIGAPATFKNKTVFPLMGSQANAADRLTLDEALAQEVADVTDDKGRMHGR
jgi:hypothetical protein